ncbi:MAG: hypothetical protein QG564_128 [Campylobacterota bacterium]|nr:hypothetical protein [Campylobacterota bacterium]
MVIMVFKNRLKMLFAKIFLKKIILFSRHRQRERKIIKKITACIPIFSNFKRVNLNEFYLIFPLSEEASNYFNANYSYLNYKKAIVPSNEAIDICIDKKRFTEFLLNNGFGNCTIKTPDILCYPYILKKRIDNNGSNTVIIDNHDTESKYKSELSSNEFFIQEYIEGYEEYAMHILMHNGEVIFYKTIKYTFAQKKFVKGINFNRYSQEVVDHSRFIDQFKNILNAIKYDGICCIDYKLQDECIKIFEINARMGASLADYIDEALHAYAKALNLSCSALLSD